MPDATKVSANETASAATTARKKYTPAFVDLQTSKPVSPEPFLVQPTVIVVPLVCEAVGDVGVPAGLPLGPLWITVLCITALVIALLLLPFLVVVGRTRIEFMQFNYVLGRMIIKPVVVNLIAGPGVGKSSTMAGVFAELKWNGVNCEMAPEYAKDKVWEESIKVLHNQIYVFGKQHHRLMRLATQVDVIITDAPIILSLIYGKKMSAAFKALVLEEFQKYNNFNYFLERYKPYVPKGRLQTEAEAVAIDKELRYLFGLHELKLTVLPGKPETSKTIAQDVLNYLAPKS